MVKKIRIRHGTSSTSFFSYAHVRFPYFLRPQKKIGQATGKSRRHVFPAVASGHRKGGEKKERIRANYLGVGGEGGAILINVFPSSSSSIFFFAQREGKRRVRALVCACEIIAVIIGRSRRFFSFRPRGGTVKVTQ